MDWEAKQQDGYFLKYIIGLTVFLYIWFQVKIQIQQRVDGDPFFDLYNCIGYFSYFAVYGFFLLYHPPTIASTSTRMFLQITFVDIFLVRLIYKSPLFSGRIEYVLSMEWLSLFISCICNFCEKVSKVIDNCFNRNNRIHTVDY